MDKFNDLLEITESKNYKGKGRDSLGPTSKIIQ
jgi:hypothetical protein